MTIRPTVVDTTLERVSSLDLVILSRSRVLLHVHTCNVREYSTCHVLDSTSRSTRVVLVVDRRRPPALRFHGLAFLA